MQGVLRPTLVCLAVLLGACEQVQTVGVGEQDLVSGAAVEGAPCPGSGTTVQCHSQGPVFVPGRGDVCLVGERRCVDREWGSCEKIRSVDLDPWASEPGVLRQAAIGSPGICQGCDSSCLVTTDTPESGDFASDRIEVDSLEDAPGGGLQLRGGGGKVAGGKYAWISSNASNAVNKLSLETLENDGVYFTCSKKASCDSDPSRTTVDGSGYVYVGNRGDGSIVKISGELDNCPDKNGNGVADTSAGEIAPKTFDVRGAIDDGVGVADECLIWRKVPHLSTCSPKALALDARGRLWVGMNDDNEYWVLDPATGNTIAGPLAVTRPPYGAAIAPDGRLWAASDDGWLQPIDTTPGVPAQSDVGVAFDTGCGVYGVAVDQLNRVFYGSNKQIGRYDPNLGTLLCKSSSGAKGVSVDAEGHMYVASESELVKGTVGAVIEYDTETLDETRFWAVEGEPRGCSPDFTKRVWSAQRNAATAAVIVPDPAPGTITYINTYSTNYTYSDFLGYSFSMFASPSGSLSRRYDAETACGPGGVSWRARFYYKVLTPDVTSVEFYARVADDDTGLPGAPEIFLGSVPAEPLQGSFAISDIIAGAGEDPQRQWLQVRAFLERNGSVESPVLQEIALEEYCE